MSTAEIVPVEAVLEPPPPTDIVNAQPSASTHAGASLLKLTKEESDQLIAPFENEQIDIRATGEIFTGHTHIRARLGRVVGVGQWALVPLSDVREKEGLVLQRWALYIRGHFVSEAWGAHQYQAENKRMTYDDAVESAKSNALTRCCKDLGIGSACWDKVWGARWKAEHCVQVGQGRDRKWYRKDAAPGGRQAPQQPASPPSGEGLELLKKLQEKAVPLAELVKMEWTELVARMSAFASEGHTLALREQWALPLRDLQALQKDKKLSMLPAKFDWLRDRAESNPKWMLKTIERIEEALNDPTWPELLDTWRAIGDEVPAAPAPAPVGDDDVPF